MTLADEPSGHLALRVADPGIGIADEDLPRAMEAFQQVDNTENCRQRGTGLGLPLVKRFIELHGGTITIDSALGAGTTVTIRLPPERVVRDVAAEAIGVTRAQHAATSAPG